MSKTDLERSQTVVMKTIRELGLQLQHDLPEIADDYRRGKMIPEIVELYGIVHKYGVDGEYVNEEFAESLVQVALRGHRGGFGITPYEGLIDEEEQKEHLRRYSSLFHAPGGRKTLELKVGIHGRTPAQRKKDLRAAMLAKGIVPWKPKEIMTAHVLSKNPKYRFQKGLNGGKMNTRLVARELNERYHHGGVVRTIDSVISALCRFRRLTKH